MDLSIAETLKDSDELIEPETCFKLCAGPGAGKTRFLINHINNVISNSPRLATGKIACITYTNIGVETIIKRLKNSINEVEVSTIHSFLYKHVVKPYLWILEEDFEFPLAEIDGHDEIIPTFNNMNDWIIATKQTYIKDYPTLKKDLMGLRWLIEDGEIFLRFRYPSSLPVRNDSLIEYKKICWKNAKISHDDILFLSYQIMKKNSRVIEIIRAKFPYIFIDEFQDTSPIQTEIIKMIGKEKTIVGVIGDYGQSIFYFQGANVNDFHDFYLNNMKLYKIENNYRSTNEIIEILNHIRNETSFKQISPNNKTGAAPMIFIGNHFNAYSKSIDVSNDNVFSLAYLNATVNTLKFGLDFLFDFEDIKNPFFKDSNSKRGWLITHIITSIEYAKEYKIKDAMKFMKKAYRKSDFTDKEALNNLIRLINNYDQFKMSSITNFYNEFIYGHYDIKWKITSGNSKEYYDSLNYYQIAATVTVNDDNITYHRTIHSSKGDEFNSALIIIPKEHDLEFILNPNIENETNRVYYVALSRSIKNLFLTVPTLSHENRDYLEQLGFKLVDL